MTPEEFDVSSENNPGDLESADHRRVSRRSLWEVTRSRGGAVLFAGSLAVSALVMYQPAEPDVPIFLTNATTGDSCSGGDDGSGSSGASGDSSSTSTTSGGSVSYTHLTLPTTPYV